MEGFNTRNDERNWAMLTHLSALAGYVIPLGNIVGPLVMWMMKKDVSPMVDEAGKKALNFNISIVIYAFIAAILTVILIGFFLLIAVGLVGLIFTIIASVKTANDEPFEYPLTIKFIN